MRPEKKLLELEQKFVRLRIVNMADIDVGVFDFDFDTTFAVLVLNKDGQMISRYGGRDSKSAESFINEASLHKSLERSLDLHARSQKGSVELPLALKSRHAQSYPFVKSVAARCVHCHDVASGQAFETFESSSFDIMKDIWIYPEPISLGLDIDPDDGATLRAATGLAKESGLVAGDRILSFNKVPVSTFSDIQYQLHQLADDARSVTIELEGKDPVSLKLSGYWKHSDITWRRLGLRISPSAGFGGSPLTAEQKTRNKLAEDGFATRVSFLDFAKPENSPLEDGDIIYSINGVEKSELTDHAALYINLNFEIDDVLELGVITMKEERKKVSLTVSKGPSEHERVMDSDSRGGMMRGGMRRGGGGEEGGTNRGGRMREGMNEGMRERMRERMRARGSRGRMQPEGSPAAEEGAAE